MASVFSLPLPGTDPHKQRNQLSTHHTARDTLRALGHIASRGERALRWEARRARARSERRSQAHARLEPGLAPRYPRRRTTLAHLFVARAQARFLCERAQGRHGKGGTAGSTHQLAPGGSAAPHVKSSESLRKTAGQNAAGARRRRADQPATGTRTPSAALGPCRSGATDPSEPARPPSHRPAQTVGEAIVIPLGEPPTPRAAARPAHGPIITRPPPGNPLAIQ